MTAPTPNPALALDPKALEAAWEAAAMNRPRHWDAAMAVSGRGMEAAIRAYLAADPEHAALRADMERLHDSLNRAEAGWLPIESAPRDATCILVWAPSWSTAAAGRWDVDAWTDKSMRNRFYNQPTHWMPLPPAPTATTGSSPDAARQGEG